MDGAPDSRTILVVDDDQDLRDAIADILSDEGYRVGQAGNGAEALTYLRTHEKPDLILLDLMMPVMDGLQFRREQRRDPLLAEIPVVVLTAAGKVARRELAAEDVVVAKPIRPDELLQLLKTYIV